MSDQIEILSDEAHPEIPQGLYCYTRHDDPAFDAERVATGKPFIPGRMEICPHWEMRIDKPDQSNGYCKLLKAGDWEEDGTMLLWDMVKECGIKQDEPEMEDGDS